MSNRKHKTLSKIRDEFRAKGWTLRSASPLLGVHWTHLHHVLTGTRHSAALVARIENLPTRS